MDTITLWEEEIAESNRSHFFENTARAIDYLMESIELDYKLIEAGIITEANEEVTSSNDNDTNASSTSQDNATDDSTPIPSNLKVKEKIILVISKVAAGIAAIVMKIRRYIKDKIQKFQQDHIADKFMNGKIDEAKMIEKLNKTKLFDPVKMYNIYGSKALFGTDIVKMIKFETGASIRLLNTNEFRRIMGRIEEIIAYATPEDFDKLTKDAGIPFIVKIEPGNAKAQIKDLYDKTTEYMNKIDEELDKVGKTIESQKGRISNIKNKGELKVVKSKLQFVKSLYKGYTQVSSMYLRQHVLLMNIMLGFSRNSNAEESNTEENTEKEEA